MRRILKALAVGLLLLNSVAALFGGGSLIDQPDGSTLSLSTSWLRYSPFHSYLLPGIILLVANGLFGLFVLFTIIAGSRKYPLLIIVQGAILTTWIIVQVFMLRTVIGLHIVMGGAGLILILCGWQLYRADVPLIEQTRKRMDMLHSD